jgi:hypothetical protein
LTYGVYRLPEKSNWNGSGSNNHSTRPLKVPRLNRGVGDGRLYVKTRRRESEKRNHHPRIVPYHHLEVYLWVTFGFGGTPEGRIGMADALLMFAEVT